MAQKVFKTPKGTELPLIQLQGKDYLEVHNRIIWLREEHQDWVISVDFPVLEEKLILAKCTIRDENDKVKAVAHRTEFKYDDLEKAETGAIGRALGHLGYGTQFALDLIEDTTKGKLADAPITPKQVKNVAPQTNEAAKKFPKAGDTSRITQAYALAKQIGWSEEDFKKVLGPLGFNAKSVNQLNDNQYNSMLQMFKDRLSPSQALTLHIEVCP